MYRKESFKRYYKNNKIGINIFLGKDTNIKISNGAEVVIGNNVSLSDRCYINPESVSSG